LGSLVINHRSSLSILYLGVVASGLGFFLWNYGARKVNTGTLAIFNDLKIPLAILISILIFNESTDLTRLVIGCVIIITALWMNDQIVKSKSRFSQI
jgi:drug/metabolite transporter (DMT)-like permease